MNDHRRAPENTPSHLDSKLSLQIGQYSDAGIKPMNEDAIGVRIPEGSALTTKGAVAIVADGVSAAEAGKEASNTAVTSFISDYYSTHDSWSVQTSGLKVLTALNRWLYGRSQTVLNTDRGYVTTFSALVLKSSSAYIFHVGDSRIYRIRDNRCEQLTRDHSVPVGDGQTYLSRALGIDVNLEVDYRRIDIQKWDRFVLTTDGIHDFIPPHKLVEFANRGDTYENTCRSIAEAASAAGSDDNLSIQILSIESTGRVDADDAFDTVSKLPFAPSLEVGQSIDGWRVIGELHATSRSEVYLVENEDSQERAALKVPSANHEDDTAYIERFIMEEWVGTRVQSPNVVSVIRPGARSFLYYLTEYIQGPTLAQLLKERTRLPVADARNIVIQIASGLRAFHRKDMIHQDIKPDNIIYTDQGVKIIDFGSTRVAGMVEIDTNLDREDNLGTLDYAAPEYRLGISASPESDQFSLGILTYELLTGKHPFGSSYQKASTRKDFQKLEYIPAYKINPLVPVWFDGAIQKALNLNPRFRYESLSEFVSDLQKPNPKFTLVQRAPLLDRDPLLFWKCLSGVLTILCVTLLYQIAR